MREYKGKKVHKKPEDIIQYKSWLTRTHNVIFSNKLENYYNVVTSSLKSDLEESRFWKKLRKCIQEFNDEYLVSSKGYNLFLPNFEPKILIKPFDSFILKTFKKNVIKNRNWDNEPAKGWVLPDNWFSRINDTIRTMFIVKYLDGVDFLTNKIIELGGSFDMSFETHYEAREEGYYAYHIYTRRNFEIPGEQWDTENIEVAFEIQITTQLQEVMRKLLHLYYRERRLDSKRHKEKWQWDYRSDEFSTNYLGHILHYVEGMIMEIREKRRSL